MGESIVLATTHVEVANEDFSRGYQEGYLDFTTRYRGKHLTDISIYGFLATNIYDCMTSDRRRAGYIIGWCAALYGQNRPEPIVESCNNIQHQVQVTV